MCDINIRGLVSVLLALLSLSVLSLHLALCLHYPSALFAVTLLLNPSLWLFLGLFFMMCTFIFNYRDRKRKLVPSSLKSYDRTNYPTYEKPKYRGVYIGDIKCKCHKYFSSRSSVQTCAYFLPSSSDTSQVVTYIASTSAQNDDVQNFSCLVKLNDGCVSKLKDNSSIPLGDSQTVESISPSSSSPAHTAVQSSPVHVNLESSTSDVSSLSLDKKDLRVNDKTRRDKSLMLCTCPRKYGLIVRTKERVKSPPKPAPVHLFEAKKPEKDVEKGKIENERRNEEFDTISVTSETHLLP